MFFFVSTLPLTAHDVDIFIDITCVYYDYFTIIRTHSSVGNKWREY